MGREWLAPSGAALLASIGFRPRNQSTAHAWRLRAIVALAIRDASEEVAGLKDGTIWLKWPNDLVTQGERAALLKVAGVLGESVTMLESGTLKFIFENEEKVIHAGDALPIPPHAPHRVEALEDSLAIDLFTPVREDWRRGDDAYLRQSVVSADSAT